MKQMFYILCYLLCLNANLWAQEKDLSGHYFNESGYEIEIKKDELNFIIRQEHLPVWSNDTLAKCTFEWADKNFIKINSKSPLETALLSMKVSQAVDRTINDSIVVVFRIPCNETLMIEIGDNNFKYYRYKYKEGNTSIKLPKNIKEIYFCINPESIMPHSADGRFYGVVCLDSHINIKIEENVNSIIIDLPALNNSFFEQYYVVDEYAKVKNNCIFWKGDVFKKR